jgi:hypothetical protein
VSDQMKQSPIASVRLEPGRHRSPDDGVCVVELASIIGGEKFSDHPGCVCPVLGGFLRSWNDGAGYADRQRLEPYASLVVGTGGSRKESRARRDICLSYGGARLDRGPLRRAAARLRMRGRIAWSVGIFPSIWLKEGAGAYAARACFMGGGSREAFALLERLLDVGSPPRRPANGNGNGLEPAPLANPVPGSSQLRVPAAISELGRHAQVPDGEDRGQGGNHNGDGSHLARGDRRQHDEEDVENHGPDHSGPEGEAQTADHSHERESSLLNAD